VRHRTLSRGGKPAACVRQRTESKPLAGHRGILKHGLERPAIAGKPAHPAIDPHHLEENTMGLGMILLVVLLLMLLGAIPTWPHSRSWGYGPSGGLSLVLIILIVLLLTGRL
jgi:hypothetical protein